MTLNMPLFEKAMVNMKITALFMKFTSIEK